MSEKKTEIIRLDDIVTTRKVPMTRQGCDMLRAVRQYQIDKYSESRGVDVEIPFPSSIHLLLKEFCHLKGLNVQ